MVKWIIKNNFAINVINMGLFKKYFSSSLLLILGLTTFTLSFFILLNIIHTKTDLCFLSISFVAGIIYYINYTHKKINHIKVKFVALALLITLVNLSFPITQNAGILVYSFSSTTFSLLFALLGFYAADFLNEHKASLFSSKSLITLSLSILSTTLLINLSTLQISCLIGLTLITISCFLELKKHPLVPASVIILTLLTLFNYNLLSLNWIKGKSYNIPDKEYWSLFGRGSISGSKMSFNGRFVSNINEQIAKEKRNPLSIGFELVERNALLVSGDSALKLLPLETQKQFKSVTILEVRTPIAKLLKQAYRQEKYSYQLDSKQKFNLVLIEYPNEQLSYQNVNLADYKISKLLESLKDDGLIGVKIPTLKSDNITALNSLNSFYHALRRFGSIKPREHILLVADQINNTAVIFVSAKPFAVDTLLKFEQLCLEKSLKILLTPNAEATLQYAWIMNPNYHDSIIENLNLDLKESSLNSPFFKNTSRNTFSVTAILFITYLLVTALSLASYNKKLSVVRPKNLAQFLSASALYFITFHLAITWFKFTSMFLEFNQYLIIALITIQIVTLGLFNPSFKSPRLLTLMTILTGIYLMLVYQSAHYLVSSHTFIKFIALSILTLPLSILVSQIIKISLNLKALTDKKFIAWGLIGLVCCIVCSSSIIVNYGYFESLTITVLFVPVFLYQLPFKSLAEPTLSQKVEVSRYDLINNSESVTSLPEKPLVQDRTQRIN